MSQVYTGLLHALIGTTDDIDGSCKEIVRILGISHNAVFKARHRNAMLAEIGALWGTRNSTTMQLTPDQRDEAIADWHANTRQSADVLLDCLAIASLADNLLFAGEKCRS